jgi:hypothetical protein
MTATLAVSRVEDRQVELIPGRIEDVGIVRATAELADAGWIVSLEVRGGAWTGRARYGAPAPPLVDGFGMSDPLLMDERFETGLALSDAVLPSTQLSGRSRVGVYFEVYGTERDEPLRVSVSAERTNRSLFRRLTGALRLTTDASVDVNWVEAAERGSGGWMPRYLTVDLSSLDEGDYRLTVQVQRASGVTATSARVIRLER